MHSNSAGRMFLPLIAIATVVALTFVMIFPFSSQLFAAGGVLAFSFLLGGRRVSSWFELRWPFTSDQPARIRRSRRAVYRARRLKAVNPAAPPIHLCEAVCCRSTAFAICLLLACAIFVHASETEQQDPADWLLRALAPAGTRSYTSAGRPGDPLNVVVIGDEDELLRIMAQARWDPADPITVRSSLRIAIDSVARKPYPDAPVSNLYVNGKKQDLAFEQPAAGNPSKRHHVRFWRIDPGGVPDRMIWIGAATYDTSIGISHTTGHITHHIAADVDSERDKLLADIKRAEGVAVRWIDGFQRERQGRNGGGDSFHTDGRLGVVTIDPVQTSPASSR